MAVAHRKPIVHIIMFTPLFKDFIVIIATETGHCLYDRVEVINQNNVEKNEK